MAKVIPTILTGDPDYLFGLLKKSETFADEVQIDVMDGVFVPSRSVSAQVLARVETDLPHEAHLMVEHPERFAAVLSQGHFTRAVFHIEASSDPRKAIRIFQSQGMQVGLALNPDTPNDRVIQFIRDISMVLFLTVDPGYYGSKFVPAVLKKVSALRAIYPWGTIGVDGGISEKNIQKVIDAGVDRVYVGSHVFLTRDPKKAYEKFQRLAHGLPRQGG